LTNAFIGDIQILPRPIALISNLTSDVQLQLDTATTTVESINATQRIYIDSQDTVLDTRITDTDALQRTYIDLQDVILNTRITDTDAL
jgi:outer membrane lipoprotein-sorting protein